MMMSEAVREVEEYLNATSAYLFRITKAELVRVENRYQYVVEIKEYGQGASTYTVSVDENGVLKNSRGEDLIEGRIASSIDPEETKVFEDLKSKWVKEDPMTETQVMDYLETFCTEHS